MTENTPVVQVGTTTEENQNPQTRNNVRNDSENGGGGRPARLSNRNGPFRLPPGILKVLSRKLAEFWPHEVRT